jgi:carboxyl-terminal processing protease
VPRRFLAGIAVASVTFALAVWLVQRRQEGQRQLYVLAELLDNIISYVSDVYVDSLTEPDLYDLAIDGLFRRLGDPYTGYLAGEDLRSLSMNTTGNYVGIGIRIESSEGLITVVTPLSGGPAEEAGILPGDRIIAVDGQSVIDGSTDHVASLLRGPEGEPVNVVVARPGSPLRLAFELTRSSIHVNSVRHAELLDDRVGYVWLETVSENSAQEVRDAITQLREEGATDVILDVRSNPGGLLTQAIEITDLFLEAGDVVAETRGRDPRMTRTYDAKSPEAWPDMPVVVLVDGFSASAAEIIAGALQDHDRALVVGAKTFGKGLVQTIFPFSRSNALKITTGRWYTPSGRSIQRNEGHLRQGIPLGHDTSSSDSAASYTTDGGRIVEGGGGIDPDIAVDSGLLDVEERIFEIAVAGRVQDFRDAISAYALELSAESTLTDPSFQVSNRMRAAVRERIIDRGIEIQEDAWNRAIPYIDRTISYRVLRYVFGAEAEMSRRTADDPVVNRARELLAGPESVSELLNRSDVAN